MMDVCEAECLAADDYGDDDEECESEELLCESKHALPRNNRRAMRRDLSS